MKKQLKTIGFPLVLMAGIMIGCTESPNEQQPEQKTVQQQIDDVPSIKIVDDKLFVDDKEIPAKDFVEKYCFPNGVAKTGHPTCMAAYRLKQKLALLAGGEVPKNW